MGLTGVRTGTNSVQIHQPVQTADPLGIDLMPQFPKKCCHSWYSIERGFQILLINKFHQFVIVWTVFLGNIVETTTADFQKLALLLDAQFVFLIHFLKPILFCYFPNTFFKKSTSICNWPTFLNRSAFSFSVSSFTEPFSKTLLAPDRNLVFHVYIWFGWRSYFLPISWIVSLSWMASITTFVLKPAVWFFLFCITTSLIILIIYLIIPVV